MEVENPAEVLRDEDGVLFEVTSPYGHLFQVTCRPGATMEVREISEPKRANVRTGWYGESADSKALRLENAPTLQDIPGRSMPSAAKSSPGTAS